MGEQPLCSSAAQRGFREPTLGSEAGSVGRHMPSINIWLNEHLCCWGQCKKLGESAEQLCCLLPTDHGTQTRPAWGQEWHGSVALQRLGQRLLVNSQSGGQDICMSQMSPLPLVLWGIG